MRTVVRTLIAVFLAAVVPIIAAPAVRAHAQEVRDQSVRTHAAGSGQLTVSIDAVDPSYATPSSTITVRGTVTNGTGSPITGVQVQLQSSTQFFSSRSEMDSYTAGHDQLFLTPEGTAFTVPGTLRSGGVAQWSASFPASSVGYAQFGVYPLAAQVEDAFGNPLTIDRTLLPYWPGKGAATPLSVAWIWPLIDAPQQGACEGTLATNSLAGSLGAGGRLDTLLTAGARWAQQDDLTWMVDPALLSDAHVMTGQYGVGGNADCTDRQHENASAAAAAWLSRLRQATSTSTPTSTPASAPAVPVYVTPYADADVAALSGAGLDGTVRMAYTLGDSEADKILSRPVSSSIAWPAGGDADASQLTSLARDGGVSTVVLNSGALPSNDGQYDNALNATSTRTGGKMGVLLADSGISGVLGSASARSSAGQQFAAEQNFLAQTAMILAEGPNLQRSLVIAPPRYWDPSAAEAAELLSMTHSAPWLHPTGLSAMAAAASRLSPRGPLQASQAGSASLGTDYISQIGAITQGATVYKDLLYRPAATQLNTIDAAVAVTTSAAWRGDGADGGWLALRKLAAYLKDRKQQVQIITGQKILLGGASGTTPVSVENLLNVEVQVRVVATPSAGGELSVSPFKDLIPVGPGQTGTVTIPLHSSAITTTTLQLQLQTEDGSPLGTPQSVSVQATRYGRALLVLIASALGVLVLASVARWIRQWMTGGRAPSGRAKGRRAEGGSGGTG